MKKALIVIGVLLLVGAIIGVVVLISRKSSQRETVTQSQTDETTGLSSLLGKLNLSGIFSGLQVSGIGVSR